MSTIVSDSNKLSDWVLEGGNESEREKFRLRIGINTIGRHSSSYMQIESVHVSRYHAEISVPENTKSPPEIKDLNSINGTFINQLLYHGNTIKLCEGDVISFGAAIDDEEDDFRELPVYVLKYQPLIAPSFPVQNTAALPSVIPEIIISDDEENDSFDMKPAVQKPSTPEKVAVGNILTIFGNVDDTILNGLQRINPMVCEAVKRTSNAELVELSSDDEKPSDKVAKGNDSFNKQNGKTVEDESEESNLEENPLIYYQALISEMKSEMMDGCDNPAVDNESGQIILNPVSPPIISLIDDADDDDGVDGNDEEKNCGDDFDEDLDRKVSIWRNLLFSSQINSSQTMKSSYTINSCDEALPIEPIKPMNNTEETAAIQSENSLIRNLFEPLPENLNTFNSDDEEVENEGENVLDSPVFKTKRRRIARISSESDASIDENDKRSPDEKRQKDKKEMLAKRNASSIRKTSDVHGNKKEKVETKKYYHRPTVISAPHLKYGRAVFSSHNSSLKKDKFGFLKEQRKERLKRISENHSKKADEKNDSKKESYKAEARRGATRVKYTTQNRGNFLCDIGDISKKSSSSDSGNTSKKTNKHQLNKNNNSNNLKSSRPPPPPLAVLPKKELSAKCIPPGIVFPEETIREVKNVIRRNAEQARKRSAPNKLRFSDVDKCYEKKQIIEQKTKQLISKFNKVTQQNSTTTAIQQPTTQLESENITEAIDIPAPDTDDIPDQSDDIMISKKTGKPKKTVRFNDTPTIYYFESEYKFTRKVDGKDFMPRLSYRHRRILIRRSFPIVDQTYNIISQILQYSNEWLLLKSSSAHVPETTVTPIPPIFKSFEQYKKIVFPVLKLEFISTLTRDMEINARAKQVKVVLDYVIEKKERITLITKFSSKNGSAQAPFKKNDLVLLEIGEKKIKTFAYVLSNRNYGRFNTKIFIEIMLNSIDAEYLRNSKVISIQAAIDNLQVTIGAYNAIYQLEATPLCKMLLNPTQLLGASNVIQSQIDVDIAPEANNDDLNSEQMKAIQEIYKKICFNKTDTTPNVSLIQGPPGTGKSVVVINLALQLIYGLDGKFNDKKILICSQSNCSIDLVAEKLLQARTRIRNKENRFKVVRFGIYEKMHPMVLPLSLKNLLEFERVKKLEHTFNPEFTTVPVWKNYKHQVETEIKSLQQLPNTYFGINTKLEEKKRELSELENAYKNALSAKEENEICKNYLYKANIVCTTLSSCDKLFQLIDYFDVCIIDEATQCTEAWNLLPLKFGVSSLVLVGDSQQIPATVLSKQAADNGLTTSLFTRIEHTIQDHLKRSSKNEHAESNVIFRLRIQYRMHPEICRFPNSFFYKNSLIDAEITHTYTTPLMPFSVFNLDFAQSKANSQGNINHIEADFIIELLKALNEYIPMENNTYGVITPYAHQRQMLSNIQNVQLPHNTIDSYQVVEKDVIVISNAGMKGVGFLANPQRLNVAITRPKKCLILCGNFRNLQNVPAWRCLLTNAQQRNVYYDICALDKSDIKTLIQRILAKTIKKETLH